MLELVQQGNIFTICCGFILYGQKKPTSVAAECRRIDC